MKPTSSRLYSTLLALVGISTHLFCVNFALGAAFADNQSGELNFQFKLHAQKSTEKHFGTLVTTLSDLYVIKGDQTFDISTRTPASSLCGVFGLFPYGFSPIVKRPAIATRKTIRFDLVAIGDTASDAEVDPSAKDAVQSVRCQSFD